MNISRRGLLIILSSPSGAGKSTLSRHVLDSDPEVRFSISATTRAPRRGEQDGREYYFKTRKEFNALVAADGMLEHAEVFGNLYGTPLAPVEDAIEDGVDVLFDVDWQGGQQIRNSPLQDSVVSVFILPPSMQVLKDRLRGRGQDSEDVVDERMEQSRDEISHWAEYDYVLVNDDLSQAKSDLLTIIRAERLKRARTPSLSALVQRLNAQYDELCK